MKLLKMQISEAKSAYVVFQKNLTMKSASINQIADRVLNNLQENYSLIYDSISSIKAGIFL